MSDQFSWILNTLDHLGSAQTRVGKLSDMDEFKVTRKCAERLLDAYGKSVHYFEAVIKVIRDRLSALVSEVAKGRVFDHKQGFTYTISDIDRKILQSKISLLHNILQEIEALVNRPTPERKQDE
jgi:hypothetical protein